MTTTGTTGVLAVTVHGPAGVLDLVVPPGTTVGDLAEEYAEQAGLGSVPVLHTRVGHPLAPDAPLGRSGIGPGDLLVATSSSYDPPAAGTPEGPARVRTEPAPGPAAAAWCSVAAGLALLAGYAAARSDVGSARDATVAVLVVGAVVGLVPVGGYARQRALAAPAFAGSAALVMTWDPHPARLPMVVGLCALVAAVTAAVARAFDARVDEGHRVWMVGGGLVFLLAAGAALAGLGPPVVWAVLLVLAVLAARFVPALAVDVPDQLLIDLERLAVTAWSARDRPRGRRGRAVASPAAVAAVAARGARLVTAAGVGIAAAALVSSALLLGGDLSDLDRTGARCQVFFAGAALLLAARSYRHPGARGSLRVAGLGCWTTLVVALLAEPGAGPLVPVTVAAVLLGALLVVVAVATGRGWRSAWWARRAEVAEALSGAAVVASVFVTVGLFRTVWELTSRVGF